METAPTYPEQEKVEDFDDVNTPLEQEYEDSMNPYSPPGKALSVNEMFENVFNEEFDSLEGEGDTYLVKGSPDLTAFNVMKEYVPEKQYLIGSVEHDIIYFALGEDELTGITQREVNVLNCCGVFYAQEYDCLCMYV